jgi:hypothetical protein
VSQEERDELSDQDESMELAEALQKLVGTPETPYEGALVGYVLIAEWMRPDENGDPCKWLTVNRGNSLGESLPQWQVKGYLHEILYDWKEDDDDDSL